MSWLFWTHTRTAQPDDCASLAPLLSLYADGMASSDEARHVAEHLPGCAACRQSLLWTQATRRALAARPIMPPPPDLRARIAEAIAASSAAPAALRPVRSFALRPAFAAAASLSVLGLLSYGLLHAPPPHGGAVPVVTVTPGPPVVATLPRDTAPLVTPGPAQQPAVSRPARHVSPKQRTAQQVATAVPDEASTAPVSAPPPAEPRMTHGITVAPALRHNDVMPPAAPKAHLPRLKKPAASRPDGALLARRDVKPDVSPTHHNPLPPKRPDVNSAPLVASRHVPNEVILPPIIHNDPTPTVRTASAENRHAPGLLDDVNKAVVRMREAGFVRPNLSLRSATVMTPRIDSDSSATFGSIYTPR